MTTEIKTAADATAKVEAEAPVDQSVRQITEAQMKVGFGIRQGDLYLIRINSKGESTIKAGNGDTSTVKIEDYQSKGEYQLAPGNTMGSRHTIAQRDHGHVEMKRNIAEQSPLLGDILVAKERFTVEHPEHAHFELPAGEYIVAYQTNWKTKRRVVD